MLTYSVSVIQIGSNYAIGSYTLYPRLAMHLGVTNYFLSIFNLYIYYLHPGTISMSFLCIISLGYIVSWDTSCHCISRKKVLINFNILLTRCPGIKATNVCVSTISF